MARVEIEKLEDVPEALRGEYKPSGGKFYLKLDDLTPEVPHPDLEKIRHAHANSKAERATALAEAKRLAEELESVRSEMNARLSDVVPAKQVEHLRKSFEELKASEIAKAVGPKDVEIKKLSEGMRKVMIHDKATMIAMACAANPESVPLYLPELQRRLVVEYDANGEPQTRVLDRAGQTSALSLKGLEEEIMNDPMFKLLNKGSQASGGGAAGASGGNGVSAGNVRTTKLFDPSLSIADVTAGLAALAAQNGRRANRTS